MLDNIVRKEMDIEEWKDKPELVERVLVRLNALHRATLQGVIALESQILEAGGEPLVKVEVTWPKPPPPSTVPYPEAPL